MSARGLLAAVAAFLAGSCLAGTAVAVVALGGAGNDTAPSAGSCSTGTPAPDRPHTFGRGAGLSAGQVANAAAIVRVGRSMGVPPRGWVIAVATAMQESTLHNSDRMADHDSVGLFQQRPSQGWGTVAQIMDPDYAARQFYDRLLKVDGWQSMPLTRAAQAVQRSAFPGAYAKHEGPAAALVDQLTAGAASTGSGLDRCTVALEVTASGWTNPVPGAKVGEGFGVNRGNHKHAGVDLITPKHTPIRSVADGTVIRVTCDAGINCDRDGSPSTPGCGWYVDIAHGSGIISRYCHQLVHPLVSVGQHVTAGQQIGWSGTSGHSSGPHVHFEIHTNGVEASRGAVDPVPFMRAHGVNLGSQT